MNQRLRWWIRVAQVRLRFFGIVICAAVIVSQWTTLRSLWDRWTWTWNRQPSGGVSSSMEYFCPMDPGQISAWPAICPICNMDLVPRKKMEAQMLPEGVIARMQFSPYRIQLAGIRTETIESGPLRIEKHYSGLLQNLGEGSVGFRVPVPESDSNLFAAAQPAEAKSRLGQDLYPVTVRRVDGTRSSTLEVTLDEPDGVPEGTPVTVMVSLPKDDQVLSIPETAVIDRGQEQLVFVESMPGIFDGVKVKLGERCGGRYPVVEGLKAGQKVASAGAFLIDAESKLNPSLAAGYFGANQSRSGNGAATPDQPVVPKVPSKKSTTPKQKLSRADLALAEQQAICPVTDLPLDAMGGPVSVLVSGRKVFICCGGCENKLKEQSEKYLAKLNQKKNN